MDKSSVAAVLNEIGTFLELKGENPFKCRAYQAAARMIESLPEDLATMVREKRVGDLKGIGEALAEKITTLVETGHLEYYEELKESIPVGLLEMLRIGGLGPKRVRTIHESLGCRTLQGLEEACRGGKIANLEGFGEKMQAKILEGIAYLRTNAGQHLVSVATEATEELTAALRKLPDVIRLEVAGSLRRRKEVVRDIDIVVSADRADRIMKAFSGHPEVMSVLGAGDTKSSVLLKSGIQADLRVVSDEQFPFALAYFTGSKDHNVTMRQRAKDRGLKLNEYGLFRGEEPVPCKDEAAIFKALDLAFIPPELRENTNEFELAAKGPLPRLLERADLRGIFHCHSSWSDGALDLASIPRLAAAEGYEYVGMSEHSKTSGYANGLSIARVRENQEAIDKINASWKAGKTAWLFKGIECDILPDGSLDYDAETLATFDFVIISVHSHFHLPEAEQTKRVIRALQNPLVTILGHPTGRLLLAREGFAIDMPAVLRAAAKAGVVVETNSNPNRLDLDWRLGALARSLGVKTSIDPDAHHESGFADTLYGTGTARKGGFTKEEVITTMPLAEMRKWLKERKDRALGRGAPACPEPRRGTPRRGPRSVR